MQNDYETVWQFGRMIRDRGDGLFGVSESGDDCTIHITIRKQDFHFDFDVNDKLVKVRKDGE